MAGVRLPAEHRGPGGRGATLVALLAATLLAVLAVGGGRIAPGLLAP
jgi:hypothetical protein